MRTTLLICLMLCALGLGAAPEPIISPEYRLYPANYYRMQSQEWRTRTEADPRDGEAWENYYLAIHYLEQLGISSGTDPAAVLAEAEAVLPAEGFTLNFLRYLAKRPAEAADAYLLAAAALRPERPELLRGLAEYWEYRGETARVWETVKKWGIAQQLPMGMLDWHYNQLMSVGDISAVLLTPDAPARLLQVQYGVRTDVLLVSPEALDVRENYRQLIWRKLGLGEAPAGPLALPDLLRQLDRAERPIYCALGPQSGSYPEISGYSYVTGLAFRYTPDAFDNLAWLASSYMYRWRLDQLRQPLASGPEQAAMDQLNRAYLPSLFLLQKHYAGRIPEQVSRTHDLILRIARRAGIADRLTAYQQAPEPQLAGPEPGLRAKAIDRMLEEVPTGTLYTFGEEEVGVKGFKMSFTEVNNANYQLFLEDLLRQRRFAYLDSAAVLPIDYTRELGTEMDLTEELAKIRESHAFMPVMNISHRAAELYCIWLGQVYNQDEKRSDTRHVRFRLPTATEFTYAALGGRKYAPYPWGGPYIMNDKDCYLANFNSLLPHTRSGGSDTLVVWEENGVKKTDIVKLYQGEDCNDGRFLVAGTESYFANNYSLYNMSGNAAEMISEDNRCMGGSWLDPAEDMRIGRIRERQLPAPSVGFRVVMEYLD
ncbi:MAG: SUMF1/EgtB/PvdO family nonheme iron enzyme [Saprospiraceae bacterium]